MDITYEITKQCGVIAQTAGGWTKELNLISWNGRPAKYDIRDWAPDHSKMGKGITLSKEEAGSLFDLFKTEFE